MRTFEICDILDVIQGLELEGDMQFFCVDSRFHETKKSAKPT